MKHLPLIFAALALAVPALGAQLYDITLSNSEKYTQCQLRYKGSSVTKFTGTNKKGKVVTKEVATSSILSMREVKAKPAAPKAEKKAADKKAEREPEKKTETAVEEPNSEEGAASGDASKEEEAKTEPAPAAPEPAAEEETASHTQNATLRLRAQLENAEKEYAELSKPSSMLAHSFERLKTSIGEKLDKLDANALEVATLQQEYNRAGTGDFQFTIVTRDQREQYLRDGAAAYKAMVIDMQEKPGARKVGGIDKFELMRERYQGIPEYKSAYEWYVRTLKALDKKWKKMLEKEESRRKNLQAAKKSAMDEADQAEFEKLRQQFEADGEDIGSVWYNPRPRNMRMLRGACTKVYDALRRNAEAKLDPAVGTVPALLKQFWDTMDEARQLMISGQLDQANDKLKNDPSYDLIRRLKATIFPQDYREPMMAQRAALQKEILERQRTRRTVKTKLDRQASTLERSTGSVTAQINALVEMIRNEKDADSGDNTVNMEDSMNEEEEEEGEDSDAPDSEDEE